MSSSEKKALKRVLIALVVIVAVAVPCGLSGLLGSRRTEIDVNSGRTRTRILMFGIVVSGTVQETRFSQAVARNNLPTGPVDYRFAYGTTVGVQKLFGTPRISATYGDALATLHTMMVVFDLRPELRENERDILAKLMSMLQAGETRGMYDFVNGLDAPGPGARATEHSVEGQNHSQGN